MYTIALEIMRETNYLPVSKWTTKEWEIICWARDLWFGNI